MVSESSAEPKAPEPQLGPGDDRKAEVRKPDAPSGDALKAAPAPLRAKGSVNGALHVASGILAGALFLAVADLIAIAIVVPRPAAGLGLRLAHDVFDVAETLGIGGLVALAAGLVARFTRISMRAGVVLAAAAMTFVLRVVIGENVTRGVQFVVPWEQVRDASYWAYLVGLGFLIPIAFTVAATLSRRPILRIVCVALAAIVLAGDQVALSDDYQGVHGIVATGAALVAGGALGSVLDGWIRRLRGAPRGRIALVVAAVLGALGVVVPPPNSVRYELFRQPCAVAPWVLATAWWRAPALHAPVDLAPSPWNKDRSSDPLVAASAVPLLPRDAVVVLLTIDAMRADDVFDPANAGILPTFTALAHDGVTFTHAIAPATQTPLSLATVFSGRPFSEQMWTEHGTGTIRFLYPADDKSVRFPEVLSSNAVQTYTSVGLVFLQNAFGVARGFQEEKIAVATTARHARAGELIDPLIVRLKHTNQVPTFLFTHLTEPHEPYDRGRTDGTRHERYVSEIGVADQYVGRVLAILKQRFPNRWALFVSSDHGEAFGEHGTHEHAKSLYEELLHVPLFAASPRFTPRKIDQRVSLADLGPTILDLFGLDTPPTFIGESLTPLLAGRTKDFTRPLFAEGRLRQSITMPDGLKVIEDLRRKVVEVYDLETDPKETRNLFDVDPARSDRALALLRAFFNAHTRTANGYRPPFKP